MFVRKRISNVQIFIIEINWTKSGGLGCGVYLGWKIHFYHRRSDALPALDAHRLGRTQKEYLKKKKTACLPNEPKLEWLERRHSTTVDPTCASIFLAVLCVSHLWPRRKCSTLGIARVIPGSNAHGVARFARRTIDDAAEHRSFCTTRGDRILTLLEMVPARRRLKKGNGERRTTSDTTPSKCNQ